MEKSKKKLSSRVFHLIKKPAGVLLIALGIPSLFLPILPGAVMILTGVVLLGEKKIRYKLKKRIEKSEGNSKQKRKRRMNMNRKMNNKGYTFLELIAIVLSIAALIAGMLVAI